MYRSAALADLGFVAVPAGFASGGSGGPRGERPPRVQLLPLHHPGALGSRLTRDPPRRQSDDALPSPHVRGTSRW